MLILGTTEKLVDAIEKVESIICFGTGKKAIQFVEQFSEQKYWNKIRCFVDNDKNKAGKKFLYKNKNIPIISFNHLEKMVDDKCIFIITCAAVFDFVEQIEKFDKNKGINTYAYTLCENYDREERAMKKTIPSSLRLTQEMLIPKKIHYTWFGGNPLPDKYKKWIDSWRKYCPEYEIIEWNESNYDVSKNQYMLDAYKNKKWGFVSDYARLDIIYSEGGIYLDTDVELVMRLDELLYQPGFVGFESEDRVGLGLGLGAVKGLPVIKELRDYYENLKFVNEDGTLNLVPSPILVTEYLIEKGLTTNGEYQILDGLTIYPEKMLSGKSGSTFRVRLAEYTRAIHHYEGSWLEDQGKEYWKKRSVLVEKSFE